MTFHVAKQALTHTGVNDWGQAEEMTDFTDLVPRDGVVRLRFLVDRLSLETFAFDGERFSANYYSPKFGSGTQSIRAIGGEAKIHELIVTELESAWKAPAWVRHQKSHPRQQRGPNGSREAVE